MRMRARDCRAGLVGAVVALVVGAGVPAMAADQADDAPLVKTAADGSITYRDPSLAHEETTTVEGRLRRVAEERPGVEPAAVLTTDGGDVVPVSIDPSALGGATSGAPVTAKLVDGSALDSALAGRHAEPVEVSSARIAAVATTATPQAHRAYVAVIENSGSKNLAASSTLQSRIDSGLAWWRNQANGAITSFTRPSSTVRYSSKLDSTARCGLSAPDALWNEAAAKFPSVNFNANGNHLVVIVSNTCDGTGIGTIGASMASSGYVTMTQDATVFPATIDHELGHNFGLDHANFCAQGCSQAVEYWNLYSVMGMAIVDDPPFAVPALDSIYRAQLGITDADEIETVPSGETRTFQLAPRSATSGLRGLEVTASDGRTYWIDWRSGTGQDDDSFYQVANGRDAFNEGRTFPLGVTVTRQGRGNDATTALMATSSGKGAYAAGQTFSTGGLVVAVNSIGSTASVTVTNGSPQAFTAAGTPTISGTAKVGSTLKAAHGTWTPAASSYRYQWLANGTPISRATGASYTVAAGQKGRRISVRVTASRPGYTSSGAVSGTTKAVVAGTFVSKTPTISGSRTVGKTLKVSPGTWSPRPTFAYRWYVNGKAISGATKTTLRLTSSMRGKKISVKVRGKKSGYTTLTRTSASTRIR